MNSMDHVNYACDFHYKYSIAASVVVTACILVVFTLVFYLFFYHKSILQVQSIQRSVASPTHPHPHRTFLCAHRPFLFSSLSTSYSYIHTLYFFLSFLYIFSLLLYALSFSLLFSSSASSSFSVASPHVHESATVTPIAILGWTV